MLARFDSFGQNLQLQFNGNAMFKSRLGGLLSLFVYMLMLGYAGQKIIKLVNLEDPTIATIYNKIDLRKTGHVNLKQSGFDLIIYLAKQRKIVNLPEDVGAFKLVSRNKRQVLGTIPNISC